MPRRPSQRLSRDRWADAALALLAAGGAEAVKVERLARRLRVTKGSFYWHFRDRRALLAAALRRWEERETEALIEAVEAGGGSPRARLARLFTLAFERRVMALELALRRWAAHDRRARAAIVRVDERRLAYVGRLFGEAGTPAADAPGVGFVACALLLGEALVLAPQDASTRARLLAVGAERLMPPAYSSMAPPRARRCRRKV